MRWAAAVVVLVLAAILTAVVPVAVFARNQVFNGDRYVATVAPLAEDPEFQSVVADRLTREIVALIDVPGLTQQLIDALDRPRLETLAGTLGGVVNGAVESFVAKETGEFVQSERFQNLWTEANRVGHAVVLRVLTSAGSGDQITVDLGRLLDEVKQRLLAKGFTAAERIPQRAIPFTVAEVQGLAEARQYVRWLNTAATWLPWVAFVLLVIGLLLAPRRGRGLVVFAATTGVLVVVLLIVTHRYELLLRNLITVLWVMLGLALAVLLWAAYHHRAKHPVV